MNADKIAAVIRRVDGDNSIGAGALAEAIVSSPEYAQAKAEAQVKVLREMADELNRLANTKSLIEAADKYEGYYAGVRAARQGAELLTRGRADRIAREAGIETGEDDE